KGVTGSFAECWPQLATRYSDWCGWPSARYASAINDRAPSGSSPDTNWETCIANSGSEPFNQDESHEHQFEIRSAVMNTSWPLRLHGDAGNSRWTRYEGKARGRQSDPRRDPGRGRHARRHFGRGNRVGVGRTAPKLGG